MFNAAVYLVHGIIIILLALIGIGPMFSIAAPDPDQDTINKLWGSMIWIFIILVLVSAFVQIRIKKVWVFLISVIGLIAFFILTYLYIYSFFLNLFLD